MTTATRERSHAMAKIAQPDLDYPTAEVVLMTPALAGRLLAANVNNRHVRQTVVSRYARDMANGVWELNGETIKVSISGRVLDGQHRLHAIVESDVSVPMFVIRGLSEEIQETVDRGLPRNIADALRLRGEVNVTVLAGAISQATVLKSASPTTNDVWPSSREALAYLDAHPQIRESVTRAEALRKTITYPATTAAALHHIFADIDTDDADAFFESLASGVGLPETSPILRLREMMIREMSAPRRMPRHRLQALTIKAWNAWRAGAPMQLLKWTTGGSSPEAFPVPK